MSKLLEKIVRFDVVRVEYGKSKIAAFCVENEIPVFYKDNLRKYLPDLPASAFPF